MTYPNSGAGLRGWTLFSLLSLTVLLFATSTMLWHSELVEALRSAIRVTARTSFALFLLTFLASSLATLVPTGRTKALLRERRFLGLSFAFSHLVHGILILIYANMFPETFWNGRTAAANIPGSVGYLFILLLAVTSFPVMVRLLGFSAWKLLHSTGSWVIAALFCYSFYKRIPLHPWYLIAFSIMVSAIVLKLTAKVAVRARKSAKIGAV
ncbi:ferric reductase-like transmembrane domain-containing protein [Rheinheimera sp. EpRS3]|uniref:ferric reductase-like transmembrane domain-containing protein n=1 Tax=Rheinheimera sp. EpRS3 TaxID=1712383 RepID=UPI00074AF967|nr:ferric reductase-like transmembrane domain-containing protein [Rheinheimera sp. EpRS3]KUM54619.1 hypothetical protein AR688_15100 [Rheinheimera sp. EpRS3]